LVSEEGADRLKVEQYRGSHFAGVKALWENAFPDDPPWNRAEVVIPAKMAAQPELFLVAVDGDMVIGAALAGYDGHRGWFYSVAVAPNYCRRGVATGLVRDMEERLRQKGCRKINLQVRSLNLALVMFYHSLGYRTEDRISMGRRLIDS
jgi:ribosomal protein S18 acetylase RimI-like enzyme